MLLNCHELHGITLFTARVSKDTLSKYITSSDSGPFIFIFFVDRMRDRKSKIWFLFHQKENLVFVVKSNFNRWLNC